MIYGIDIGSYTKQVNWELLKAAGIEFAIIKATQGDYLVNKYFPLMAEGAAAAGMVVGLYHWNDPLRDAQRQADYFLSKTQNVPFHFATVDIEQFWADWNQWPNSITKFIEPATISSVSRKNMELIQNAMPNSKVLVYTRTSFVNDYAKPMLSWLPSWPLWVAHWAFNAGRTITTWENLLGNGKPYNLSPWLPSGCPGYVFHQWSGDRFVLPGMYESTVDMNSYDGSVNDLREWVGLPPLETKDELLAKLETETDNFITRAIQLEKALKEYIQSVKG